MDGFAKEYGELFGLTEMVENELSKKENFGELIPVEGIEKELLEKKKNIDDMEAISITKVLKSKCGRLAYTVLAENGVKGKMRITPGTIYAHPVLGAPPFSFDSNEMKDFSIFFVTDVNPLSQDEDYIKRFITNNFGSFYEKYNGFFKETAIKRDSEAWFKKIASPVFLNYKWMYENSQEINSIKKSIRNAVLEYLTTWIKMVKDAEPIEDKDYLQKLISNGDKNMDKFRKNDKGFKVLTHYYGIDFAEKYMRMLFPAISHIKKISGELKL